MKEMKKINVVQSYHNCGAPNSCTSKNQNSKPLSLKRHHSQFESPEVEKSDHKKMKKNFENSKRYNNLEISSENFDFMSSISRSEQESTSSDDSDDIQHAVQKRHKRRTSTQSQRLGQHSAAGLYVPDRWQWASGQSDLDARLCCSWCHGRNRWRSHRCRGFQHHCVGRC
jgi:hypothetical protein